MANHTEWAEELPPKCPPEDAFEPDDDSSFYRLVDNIPPQECDFWSHRKLYPSKKFKITECVTRSCSLISTFERCKELSKLPTQQNKKIIKIVLTAQAGLVKQTGKDVCHYSWWRAKKFNPTQACMEAI